MQVQTPTTSTRLVAAGGRLRWAVAYFSSVQEEFSNFAMRSERYGA
jgi:hypothetical protein